MSPKRAALMLLLAVLLVAGGFVLGRVSVPEVGLATAVTTSPPPTTAPETTAVMVTEPPGNVYPVSHVIAGHCEQLGDFEVTLHGIVSGEANRSYESVNISAVEIRSKESGFYQLIAGIDTYIPASAGDFGFYFEDWNSDGYLDLSLERYLGGTMHNTPSYFWLWDVEDGHFEENGGLMVASETSTLTVISREPPRVRGYWRGGPAEGCHIYYDYINGRFVAAEMEETYFDDETEDGYLTIISHLINGEWVIVEETRVSYGD